MFGSWPRHDIAAICRTRSIQTTACPKIMMYPRYKHVLWRHFLSMLYIVPKLFFMSEDMGFGLEGDVCTPNRLLSVDFFFLPLSRHAVVKKADARSAHVRRSIYRDELLYIQRHGFCSRFSIELYMQVLFLSGGRPHSSWLM